MAKDTFVGRELPAFYRADARASAPAGATLPFAARAAAYCRRGTPPAFMPPSITSSLPVT
jgi:hypothetical protein